MQEALKVIIDIQELDMKMIRLMRLKKERQRELEQIAVKDKAIEQYVKLLKEREIAI